MAAAMRESERDIERRAYRVINHTCKRVMSNTAQCCEYVARKLMENTAALEALGADGEEVVQLLTATRTQSVSGCHMSRSMILQASIIRGEHSPGLTRCTLSPLHARALFSRRRAPVRGTGVSRSPTSPRRTRMSTCRLTSSAR